MKRYGDTSLLPLVGAPSGVDGRHRPRRGGLIGNLGVLGGAMIVLVAIGGALTTPSALAEKTPSVTAGAPQSTQLVRFASLVCHDVHASLVNL